MASCPKCGRAKLPKRPGLPRACRHCGPLREAQPKEALSLCQKTLDSSSTKRSPFARFTRAAVAFLNHLLPSNAQPFQKRFAPAFLFGTFQTTSSPISCEPTSIETKKTLALSENPKTIAQSPPAGKRKRKLKRRHRPPLWTVWHKGRSYG